MRNFMKKNCKSGYYAEITAHKERGTYGKSISKVMSEISCKIKVACHFDILFMIMWFCKKKKLIISLI